MHVFLLCKTRSGQNIWQKLWQKLWWYLIRKEVLEVQAEGGGWILSKGEGSIINPFVNIVKRHIITQNVKSYKISMKNTPPAW